MREREKWLVLNPGTPPRRRKKISRRKRNPEKFNSDLILRLDFIKSKLENRELNEVDTAIIRNCLRRISDLFTKNLV